MLWSRNLSSRYEKKLYSHGQPTELMQLQPLPSHSSPRHTQLINNLTLYQTFRSCNLRWCFSLVFYGLLISSIFQVPQLVTAKAGPVAHFPSVEGRNAEIYGSNVRIRHMQVHRTNGKVYVGAVNRIFQLDQDLQLEHSVVTGPLIDNPRCPVNKDCGPTVDRGLMDNENRLMLVHYEKDRLITCGTVSRGSCELRDALNISTMVGKDQKNVPVVGGNASLSVVGVVAPAPNVGTNGPTKAVYIGRTVTLFNEENIFSVATRSLDPNNAFELIFMDPLQTSGTILALEPRVRDSFRVNYLYGFTSGRFTYFVIVQPKSQDNVWELQTRLARVCTDDVYYYSYTEVPVVCTGSNGSPYNVAQAAVIGNPGTDLANNWTMKVTEELLFVSFSNGKPNGSGKDSAICVYSVLDIQRQFTENIRQCFAGFGSFGLVSSGQSPCQKAAVDITDNFCGESFNYPVNGAIPLQSTAVAVIADHQITSLSTTVTHSYTVVFAGTADGKLKKVVVESKYSGRAYAETIIDEGNPVLADMQLSPTKEFIYVTTQAKVSKLRVEDCSVYTNCGDCLGKADPYCGWCSLENKCGLRAECSAVKADSAYWISYKSQKCTRIASVTPNQIQRTTARTLVLTIDNLPSLPEAFVCVFVFEDQSLETNASRTSDGISCATPRVDLLPEIPDDSHAVTARLSFRMLGGGPDFSTTNVTFYDCAALTDCGSCVSSPYPCDWCVQGHRCTHDAGENCRNNYLVNGQNRSGYSSRSGPDFCPRIRPATDFLHDSYILVPSGMLRQVTVRAENIQPFQSRFFCLFYIDGRVERTEASVVSDLITCSPLQFTYMHFEPNATARFDIAWGEEKPLDNPHKLTVLMYKCAAMSSNCGFCLDLPVEFECGWCEKTCQVTNQCPTNWLNRNSTCPNPEIIRFSPSVGPWEGGTKLTIEGVNLGKSFSDIMNGVQVAGRRCTVLPEQYERTSRIVCETDAIEPPIGELAYSGDVTVNIASQFTAISPTKFTYVDPKLFQIQPRSGPRSGGTLLTITGRYLNAGSSASVNVGTSQCIIITRNSSEIVCNTSSANTLDKVKVKVTLDRGERVFESDFFEYVADPEITKVWSFGSGQADGRPRGTPSGGSIVFVDGVNLNVASHPQIVFSFGGKEYYGPCEVNSSTLMECRTPQALDLTNLTTKYYSQSVRLESDRPLEIDYGFVMDGVLPLRNLSRLEGRTFEKFQLFPDPVVRNFTEANGIKYHKSEYLFIEGENLNQAYKMEDYVVEVGMSICNITSLSRKQLTCRPPDNEPTARGPDGQARIGALPEVRVIIGDTKNFSIGYMSYQPLINAFAFSTEVIIGISVGGGVLVLLVIAFLIAYKRKATESTRVLKTMQNQIDVLELQVASECKEAFAELQTDITDWTADLSTGGIPFRDYRWYVAKVLFPNADTHPVMTGEMAVDPVRKQNIDNGLKLFGGLLLNKTFLLTFIRTLEGNRYFGMRDRVNVASLLMAVLQSDMVYCTDILKTLLAELIEKCVDGKSNPNLKLLMRRNESVAEKMLSAWLTFLLYPFLKEVAGSRLYLMYRAVQMQIEKGPVDYITSDAKYSLSEEKLIRQKIDYKKLVIYVSCVDPEHNHSDYPVKVLDCDSVTQVKEKALDVVYRNTPYSRRPRPENLDLEWRTGQAGRCPLQDEDQTSVTESGGGGITWRRFNTLAHYHVNDGAAFVLVPKHTNFYNLTIMSDKSDKSFASHKSSPVRGQSPFVRGDGDLEHGVKQWHLVKPHDSQDGQQSRDGTTKRGNKMVTEIYLTRLLTTKTTLKKFIDEIFETILSTSFSNYGFPLAIKYLFDFLDDQALHHEIQDPEVVHTWKSNSLPLRFWVNLIKNPNFLFNIHKSNSVDSCLSVIAQALMESCSTSDLKLSKDSPSSKLLFAKDISIYQEWVRSYYDDIKYKLPEVTEQDFSHMLAQESKAHKHDFHTRPALLELFTYAKKHMDPLMTALNQDDFSSRDRLPNRLLQVVQLMNAENRM